MWGGGLLEERPPMLLVRVHIRCSLVGSKLEGRHKLGELSVINHVFTFGGQMFNYNKSYCLASWTDN